MGAFRVGTRFVAFVRIFIIARILSPEDFGLFGIASLLLVFAETFSETGIGMYLIQKKDKYEEYIDTSWVLSILRGIFLSFLLMTAATFVGSFFNAPDAPGLIRLIALVSFIRGFINPTRIIFIKDLQFRNEVVIGGSVYLIDSIVTVILAFVLRSPYCFVWGLVAGALTEVFVSFRFIKPIPKLNFDYKKVKEIISRGKWVTFSSISYYLFKQVDDIVVGKLLGTFALGIYQAAYKISTLPITEVSLISNKITFPIFTKIESDRIRLKRAFFRTMATVSLLTIPIGVIIFLFPYQIVLILLGQNWIAAVDVLKALAIFGVVRALMIPPFALFDSVKKQEYVTILTAISLIGMGIFLIPFVQRYGVLGAAYATIIGSLVAYPFEIYYLKRVFNKNN
jgi:O-antigen/teichoic acid export membrane protein